jgi:hypothetical protein
MLDHNISDQHNTPRFQLSPGFSCLLEPLP